MHWREIIRRPIVTEKSNFMASEHNQYAFEVAKDANKIQITEAIQLIWPDVEVSKVRVANIPMKRARRMRATITRKPAYKKAIVTLSKGTIDVFEGVG